MLFCGSMNYCSLQEAYNVPSFAASRKKKPCNAPPPPPPTAGAQMPYEPHRDEFEGKEYARYTRYGNPAAPRAPPSASVPAPAAAASTAASAARENFQGSFEPTYKAMQRDMKYYCNEYGVCTPGSKPVRESFQSEITQVPQNADKPRTAKAQQKAATAAPQVPRCALQAPIYEYPLSEEGKSQFAAAMQLALDEDTSGQQLAPLQKPRTVDMEDVDGFYDEEIESYLATKDMKSAPMPEMGAAKYEQSPTGYDKTPFAEAMSSFEKNKRPLLHPEPRPFGPECQQVEFWQNLWDIALFVLAGILVILLVDQLYKLAVYQGMRHTIEVLEPFLAQFRDV